MPGAWTTITVLDGNAVARNMRVWDESGVGTGPYSFAQLASDEVGAGGKLALETGNLSTLAQGVNGTTFRVISFVGANAVSSSNGDFTNLLQNNGTLTPTNGIFANVMFNNAIVSASVGLPVNILAGTNITAVISGTTFISGGTNMTAVVSGTTFVSGGAVTATLDQGGNALSATNGIYANILFNNALVSASVGLPVNILQGTNVTAVVSGTTFISGGTNITAVVSGTTFISGGTNITAVVSGQCAGWHPGRHAYHRCCQRLCLCHHLRSGQSVCDRRQ